MNAQASANTLWAFSRLEPPPPALCDALLRRAEACARDMSAQGVANVCGACARFGGAADAAAPLAQRAERRQPRRHRPRRDCVGAGGMVAATPEAPPPLAFEVAPEVAARGRAEDLDWQAAGHVEFGMRMLRRLGGVWVAKAAAAAAAAAEAPIRSAALAAVQTAQERRGDVDAAAAVVVVKAAPWSSLPRGATVLLAPTPSAGGASEALEAALQAVLKVRHRRRMSEAGGAEATAWPAGGSYDAALLRPPHTRGAFEYALHAVAAVLRPGAPLLVFGSRAEGIATAASWLRAAPIAPAPAGAAVGDGVAHTPGGDATAVGVVRATCAGSAALPTRPRRGRRRRRSTSAAAPRRCRG